MYKVEVIDAVGKAIQHFSTVSFDDRNMVIALKSTAHAAVLHLQQWHLGWNSDVLFFNHGTPYLKIIWWDNHTGDTDDVIFRFNPLRVDLRGIDPFIEAYDRAMSII